MNTGPHINVEISSTRDINGLCMVTCRVCGTCAHAVDEKQAMVDLAKTKCSSNCENCKSLRASYDGKPAVPLGGTCNDVNHVCPNDGNRWWQYNTHFHLWKQVTANSEWNVIGQ
jgi:hypothetical protein